MELTHAGAVDIGAGCHIFANAVIARGLFRESTHIGPGCRVGNSAFVSHNCSVGEEAFIGHGAVVNGNVRVGSHTWIGPGATVVHGIEIGEGANVSLGATVMRDVEAGKHVTGSMAIAHRKMLRLMAAAEGGKQH
jgi:UDP-3-O-[3-hydroxymyristoyl] glucosamine N-acyltransferase